MDEDQPLRNRRIDDRDWNATLLGFIVGAGIGQLTAPDARNHPLQRIGRGHRSERPGRGSARQLLRRREAEAGCPPAGLQG